MSDATTSLLVLGVTVVLFVGNRLPVGAVAVLCPLALLVTGQVDAATVVGGFGDPVVVFIACLFILAGGLEQSGVTAWAGRQVVARAGTSRGRVLVALMALAAVLTAFVTPNGSAAALLPVAVLAARRSARSPSALLMPLAFAASAGGLLMLSASPVNVIVSDDVGERVQADDVVVVTGTSAQVARLVDESGVDVVGTPLTRATREALLGREAGLAEVVVPPRSSFIGQRVFPGQVRSGLTVLDVRRLGHDRGAQDTLVAEGDLLLLHGPWAAVEQLRRDTDVLVVDETVLLGQVVSNTATVLVVTPIALSAAADAGVAPAPVLVLVAVAGAASFLTPIATPANMIVMGPAGYRFGDYWRLGLALTVAWFVMAVALIPAVWGT